MNFAGPQTSRSAAAQTADLTVVGGAGHVGVPLVLSFAAKGLSVNVNDRNEEALKVLQSGRLPFIEIGANELLTKALAEKKLTFTSRPNEISTKGPVIVTIGTPVDEFLNPVRRVIQDCLDEIVPHLKDGQLIVLRSTIYPGTTEWIDDYFKRAGRKLKIAFCPERIVQGNGIEELRKMPQIVSGTTPEAEEEAAALFKAARQLENCRREWDAPGRAQRLDEALRYNQRLWTFFQAELTAADCALPMALRRNLLQISAFIDKRTFEMMANATPEGLQSLIEIDRQIARRFPKLARRAALHDVVDAEPTLALFREEEPFTHESDWFVLRDAYLQIRPYTQPHMPVAVAAVQSPAGMMAARAAATWRWRRVGPKATTWVAASCWPRLAPCTYKHRSCSREPPGAVGARVSA